MRKMFEQTINLIGKPLNDPDLQAYFTEHGFKPAKKTEISGRTSERDFWLEHKKLGINLLFDIDSKNPLYPPVAGSKKGLWLPILRSVTFLDAKTAYPLGLKMGLSYADASQILGAPSYKSSDIAKIWLNDDGSESFYGWHKTIDEAKQITLHARIQTDGAIDEINVEVIALKEVFVLFDAFANQNLSDFFNNANQYNSPCIFIEWAIKNGLYLGQADEQTGIAAVKNGLSMRDFFQNHIKTAGFYLPYFAPAHQQFVRQYVDNMSGHDVYFGRDYMLSFLTNNAERNNYLGEDALNTLAKVALNDENKAKMFAVLDARFAEFNAHGFAKSKVELKP
jgi:hypothetical protein